MAIYRGGSSGLGGGVGSLDSLVAQRNDLHNTIITSPTYGGDSDPTSTDTYNETRLFQLNKQISNAQKTQAKAKWFPQNQQQQAQTEEQKPGILSRILNVVSMPLYAIEGAVAYTLGQGQGQGLVGSAVKNATTGHQTFGDLLKKTPLPWAMAAPLGFAMDIALDPLNWATAGTAAVLPRVAMGAIKGGVAGAAAGLESSLPARLLYKGSGLAAKGATGLATHTPIIGKRLAETTAAATGKTLSTSLKGRLTSAAENYDTITGRQLSTSVDGKDVFGKTITDKRGWYNPFSGGRFVVGDAIKNIMNRSTKGSKLYDFMHYSEGDSLKADMMRDLVLKHAPGEKEFQAAIKAHLDGSPIPGQIPYSEFTPSSAAKAETFFPDFGQSATAADPELDSIITKLAATPTGKEMATNLVDDAKALNGAETILTHPQYGVVTDPVAAAARMVEEGTGAKVTAEDIRKLANDGMLGETGAKWFDNAEKSVMDWKKTVMTADGQEKTYEYGKNLLEGYKTFVSMFKSAKVFQNPASWTNAVLGNPIMYGMHGMNPLDPKWMAMVKNYNGVLRGKSNQQAFLHDLMARSEVTSYLDNYSTTFSRRGGATPAQLAVRAKTEEALRLGREEGIIPASTKVDDIAPLFTKALEDLKMIAGAGAPGAADAGKKLAEDAALKAARVKMGGLEQYMEKIRKGDKISQHDLPVSMLGAEFLDNAMTQRIIKKIETEAAQPGANPAWKLLNLMYVKAGQGYEKIDQSYRGGTFFHGVVNGYTEQEMMKMRRTFNFRPEDLASKATEAGVTRYRVTPQKAMEIADTAYLNYQAMPGFVRVMRNFPLLGSPFMSFAYGMVGKTGRTLAYNPSFFNKVNFGMQDFGGSKGPTEKNLVNNSAINPKTGQPFNQYYQYLKQDGMFRLPFFQNNPAYINLASMIPYYSLNFFNPSNRSYKDVMPDKLIALMDQTPFLKDPLGSTLLDYFIQPMILKDSQPVGQFGQPLYPLDAGAGEKALYGLRNFSESLVPGWAAIPAGLGLGAFESGGIIPQGTSGAVPSYRARQIANAMQGLNSYGVPFTSEDPAVRTMRNIGGAVGINVQAPVNLTFNSNNGKK